MAGRHRGGVRLPWAALGGGVAFAQNGSALDAVDVVARLSGSDRPSLDRPTGSSRSAGPVARRWRLGAARRWAEALERDDDVAGVLLILDGFSGSTGDIQEVRRTIASLQRAGKPVGAPTTRRRAPPRTCAERRIARSSVRRRRTAHRHPHPPHLLPPAARPPRHPGRDRQGRRVQDRARVVHRGRTDTGARARRWASTSTTSTARMTADLAVDLDLGGPGDAAALSTAGRSPPTSCSRRGWRTRWRSADEVEDEIRARVDASIVEADLDEAAAGGRLHDVGPAAGVVVVRLDGSMIDARASPSRSSACAWSATGRWCNPGQAAYRLVRRREVVRAIDSGAARRWPRTTSGARRCGCAR